MMQDWLAQHKMDRKALANMAANLVQFEAYEAYIAHEVEATVAEIIQAVVDSEQPTAQEAAQTMLQAPAVEHTGALPASSHATSLKSRLHWTPQAKSADARCRRSIRVLNPILMEHGCIFAGRSDTCLDHSQTHICRCQKYHVLQNAQCLCLLHRECPWSKLV